MIHAHITTWVVALVLFFVAIGLNKSGKAKGLKVVQMILRLFYLLIIGTGVWILSSIHSIDTLYVIKSLVGILVIGMMEMIIVRSVKGKNTAIFWLLFIVSFVLVLYLGFIKLPLTFLP
ncbi:YisL family protein [Bacillus sp. FJAT-29790]|uniref:YisL family protein n=1 Tax=Bacillus sp. FJAT-29790 TaxID=1895002 RepID=UPI001C24AD3C|nr:YisL family protein [Bacillus sp. FJAT-29790]MBU8877420.1 YisL family protein [Bacillus sp. FJAT-29790]